MYVNLYTQCKYPNHKYSTKYLYARTCVILLRNNVSIPKYIQNYHRFSKMSNDEYIAPLEKKGVVMADHTGLGGYAKQINEINSCREL